MNRSAGGSLVLLVSAALLGGCSAVTTGARMGMNAARQDSHLAVWLDGQRAEQSFLKKTVVGRASFRIVDDVSTTPTLRFKIEPADKLGKISMVTASIYPKIKGEYASRAAYRIFTTSRTPESQMQPGEDYNLGGPAGQMVQDANDQPVSGVSLDPDTDYMLQLTVVGDRSETIDILFRTR